MQQTHTTRLSLYQQRGLACRQCGCRHFRVLYTRAVSGERLVRRRECRNCGRRMTTYEVSADSLR